MNKTDLLQNFTLTEVLIFSCFFVFQKSLFVELSGALVSPIFVKTSNPTPKFLVQLVHILKLKVKCTSPLAIDCSINNLNTFLKSLLFSVHLLWPGNACLWRCPRYDRTLRLSQEGLTVTMMVTVIMIMTITITQ